MRREGSIGVEYIRSSVLATGSVLLKLRCCPVVAMTPPLDFSVNCQRTCFMDCFLLNP